MHIDGRGNLYVLDSGNGRIVVLDSLLHARRVIDSFTYGGEPLALNDPSGIFVDADGLIYVADTGNGRIVVLDEAGSVQRIIGEPVSDILTEGNCSGDLGLGSQ